MIEASLGAFADELGRLEAGLLRAAAGEADAEMMDAAAERGKELLLATWSEQAAPDGTPWAPRARPYGWPPLDRSGEMKGSADVQVTGLSLVFIVADAKAIFHQFGTQRGGMPIIPPRPMIFAEDERPERWISGMEEAAQVRLDRWMADNLGAAA